MQVFANQIIGWHTVTFPPLKSDIRTSKIFNCPPKCSKSITLSRHNPPKVSQAPASNYLHIHCVKVPCIANVTFRISADCLFRGWVLKKGNLCKRMCVFEMHGSWWKELLCDMRNSVRVGSLLGMFVRPRHLRPVKCHPLWMLTHSDSHNTNQ